MTQPQPPGPSTQRVIFLPPGVMPAPQPLPQQQVHPQAGLPFDRTFFEQVLPGSIASFCQQVKCTQPVVEVLTVDGVTHFVRGVSGLSDAWVALHTRVDNHDEDIQVFIPYASIFRVAIHPAEDDHKSTMGFLVANKGKASAAVKAPPGMKEVGPPAAPASARRTRPRPRKAT